MLLLTCPNCGAECAETELSAGGEAHLKRFGLGADDAGITEGRMIDESVAAAVPH